MRLKNTFYLELKKEKGKKKKDLSAFNDVDLASIGPIEISMESTSLYGPLLTRAYGPCTNSYSMQRGTTHSPN